MDHDAAHAHHRKANEMNDAWLQFKLNAGIDHDCNGSQGADIRSQVHRPERDQESGIYRKQQHEVQTPCPDMFRELCDVVEENSVEKLLDEIGCSDEKNNLISTPASDMVCVRIDY